MKQFNYKGQWYTIGDTINMGFFQEKWEIVSIHYDCSCVIIRNGKTKVLIGSVRIPDLVPTTINTSDFNNWMNYIHNQRR